jgi:uncharacterized protein (TIGR03067 family)
MRLFLALLFGTTLLFAAPVPKEKPKVKDEEAVLGKWEFEQVDAGSAKENQAGTRALSGATIEFKKENKITVTPPAKAMEKAIDGEVKLNDAAKVKEFDVEINGIKLLGLYELDGDSLKICVQQGDGRPKELKATAETRTMVVTLKRLKDEKKEK